MPKQHTKVTFHFSLQAVVDHSWTLAVPHPTLPVPHPPTHQQSRRPIHRPARPGRGLLTQRLWRVCLLSIHSNTPPPCPTEMTLGSFTRASPATPLHRTAWDNAVTCMADTPLQQTSDRWQSPAYRASPRKATAPPIPCSPSHIWHRTIHKQTRLPDRVGKTFLLQVAISQV